MGNGSRGKMCIIKVKRGKLVCSLVFAVLRIKPSLGKHPTTELAEDQGWCDTH